MVDPITLGAKLVDVRDKRSCCCDDDFDLASVPESVCRVFDDSFIIGNESKNVFVSLGALVGNVHKQENIIQTDNIIRALWKRKVNTVAIESKLYYNECYKIPN